MAAKPASDSANLPAPKVITQEITENLEAALAQFAEIAADLSGNETTPDQTWERSRAFVGA